MIPTKSYEVWLRGPIPNIPPLVQPVAHALLQAKEEITELMKGFPEELLWVKPAELASPGFHLQHLTGVLDRLFTYARGEALSDEQLSKLKTEGHPDATISNTQLLVDAFQAQVEKAIKELEVIDEHTLLDYRGVGRANLPSTRLGLFFHAAEHTMRHVGQLLVTVRVLKR